MLQKLDGNFSEGELADISRIVESQYRSHDCRLVVFSYLDDLTGKHVAAFHYTPNSMPRSNGSSKDESENYTPHAVGCFDVEE